MKKDIKVQLIVRIEREHIKEIKELAESFNTTQSEITRIILKNGIKLLKDLDIKDYIE